MSAGGGGESRDVNALAASLQSHGQDVSLYAGMLLNTLASALPAHMVKVEREGGRRLLRRPKSPAVTAVTVTVADRRFTLTRRGPAAVPEATVEHVVRGIVLSSDSLPVTQWADQLGAELSALARRDSSVANAIDTLISGLPET